MIARSFRSVAARLIPGSYRAKQTLPLVAALILAGCGGSPPAKPQVVRGAGYRFAAPAGWHVHRTRLAVTAQRQAALVQVSTFPLVKEYRPALFAAVSRELQTRMRQVALQMGGTVSDVGEVTSGGVRSHVYRVEAGGLVDEYTFVLVGRREYQLLCRAKQAGDATCSQLQTSFVLA